ncbi:MAG TPA: hypothetical protein VHO29_11800 [Marmoricola sp.]|nr:hypothetical protein [Marmoricola sp.]
MAEVRAQRASKPPTTLGHRFATALAAKDRAALLSLLADDVDFAGLTPGRSWQADTATGVVDDVLLGCWFEDSDHIEDVEEISTGEVGGRAHLAYRFRVRNPDGLFLVEQQAYYDTDAGRITWLRILCSGFRPAGG